MSEHPADVGASRSNFRNFGVKTAVLTVTVVLLAAVGCGAGQTDTREDVFGVGATPTFVVDGENGSVVGAGLNYASLLRFQRHQIAAMVQMILVPARTVPMNDWEILERPDARRL